MVIVVCHKVVFYCPAEKKLAAGKKKLKKGLDGILDANYFSLNYCLEKILTVCDFFRRQSSPCMQSIATICNIVLVFSQVINNYIYNNNKLGWQIFITYILILYNINDNFFRPKVKNPAPLSLVGNYGFYSLSNLATLVFESYLYVRKRVHFSDNM